MSSSAKLGDLPIDALFITTDDDHQVRFIFAYIPIMSAVHYMYLLLVIGKLCNIPQVATGSTSGYSKLSI